MSLQDEMANGWKAGWRGDEIVTEKSTIYMEWYEIGRAEREAHECQTSMNSSSVAEEASP